MELKVGDKVRLLRDVPWAEVHAYYLKGSELIITEKLVDGSYFAKNGYGRIARIYNRDFEKVEENQMNKIKMVIGENRVVECGEYKIVWCYENDYTIDSFSTITIYKNKYVVIHYIRFDKYNYKQQMEIANLILDKLGLNVELVEKDNSEVLEQIGKLESELEKLRGMVK